MIIISHIKCDYIKHPTSFLFFNYDNFEDKMNFQGVEENNILTRWYQHNIKILILNHYIDALK